MDLVRDLEGSVTFGWAGAGVYYSRFAGTLSVGLGDAHAEALANALAEVRSLRYFADSSELTSYDLLARSTLVRQLLSHRKKFTEIVILNWTGGLSAPGRALMDAVGQPLSILNDRLEFEQRLRQAAPLSAQAIRSARQQTVVNPSLSPPLRR